MLPESTPLRPTRQSSWRWQRKPLIATDNYRRATGWERQVDYTILTAELTDDPLGRGYSAMSDQEVADSLNTADRPTRSLVPIWQIEKHAVENGYRLAIESSADQWTATPEEGHEQANQVCAAAKLAVRYLECPRFENLDMDLASTQAMVAGLVAGGVITQDAADAIDAMADGLTTRAAELGLPRIDQAHAHSARELNADG